MSQRFARAARLAAPFACAALLAVGTGPATADPSAWAPAQGWRVNYEGERRYRHPDDQPAGYRYRDARHAEHHFLGSRRDRQEQRERIEHRPRQHAGVAPLESVVDSRCGLYGALVATTADGALGAQFGGGSGQLASTGAGTLRGYLAGSSIGRSMDLADRDCLGRTLERVADAQTVAWSNPDARASYRVTPYETYRSRGRYRLVPGLW